MPTTNGADGPTVDSDVAIAEAKLATLEVLADVTEWRLPAARWERVAEIVESIDAAVLSGDVAALEAATVDLELMGPVRITRIGSKEDKAPAPPQVRERVNRLQHSLTGQSVHRGEVNQKGDGRGQTRDPR